MSDNSDNNRDNSKKEFIKDVHYTYKGHYIGIFVEYIGVQYGGDYYWDGKAKFSMGEHLAIISKGAYVYIKEVLPKGYTNAIY